MKKLLSLAVSAIMAFSLISSASAEIQVGQTVPSVFVDDREIGFRDQAPVLDVSVNRTMVPARGVFEAMGADVNWNAENRTVRIDSKDNLTRLVLEIDNPVMKVYKAVSLTKYDESTCELDAAPVILNNRTLIPLRAISENMEADVDWDGENHVVDIHTKEYKKYIAQKTEESKDENTDDAYDIKNDIVNLSLSADKESAEAGEDVVINVNMSNTGYLSDKIVQGVAVGVYYDSSKFTFKKAELLSDGEAVANVLGASNEKFMNDSVKTALIVMPSDEMKGIKVSDTAILRLTFTSVNGEAGEFSLSDRKVTEIGNDTGILFADAEGKNAHTYQEYTELYIDKTPVEVK